MGGAAEEHNSTSLPGLLKGSVRWEIQCARDADNRPAWEAPVLAPWPATSLMLVPWPVTLCQVCFVPLVEPCLSMPASGRILFVWAEAGLIPDIL